MPNLPTLLTGSGLVLLGIAAGVWVFTDVQSVLFVGAALLLTVLGVFRSFQETMLDLTRAERETQR